MDSLFGGLPFSLGRTVCQPAIRHTKFSKRTFENSIPPSAFPGALEPYSEVNLTHALAPIDAMDANPQAIRHAYDGYASEREKKIHGLGSLIADNAIERAALDLRGANLVDAILERLMTELSNAVENFLCEGDFSKKTNFHDLAAHFVNAFIMISNLLRAGEQSVCFWPKNNADVWSRD